MLFAGIDIGSLTAEAVIIESGEIVGSEIISVLPNPVDSAKSVLGKLLSRAGLCREQIAYTVSTGYGREKIQAEGLADENMSEISCHGFGAYHYNPDVRTVIDIGGQDAKVIKIDRDGKLLNFVMNDKCAAGTGQFLEVMSRALGVDLNQLGEISLRSRKPVPLSSRCTIYAETEVMHCLQRGVPKNDIAAGISGAIAKRVAALVKRVGIEPPIMITGGVAKNAAVRREIEKELEVNIIYPNIDPQIIGAYGAAAFAMQKAGKV
ncbi:MAG: 2-hydroxyglutaryl-CoA dehydratase [Deltaproteobacteria bacterium]|nr:2-hydroxyglutaryl-CoA dehydratase [Deltaproteobacteria bacterium]